MAFITFSVPIFSLFTGEREVLDIARQMMFAITPWYFLFVPIEMTSASLRGMGNTFFPTLITAGGICVFRVIWMLAVVPHWHAVRTICLSYPISWSITSAVFIVYYLAVRKRLLLRGSF